MSTSSNQFDGDDDSARLLLQSALDQVNQESMLYNKAVGSYNTHLDNHRGRRNLHDIPFREPITAMDEFSAAINGEPEAIDTLISHLIDEAHLDSQLRCHPRTYPIHMDAVEHLQLARDQLLSTLEEAYCHAQASDN